MGNSHRPDSHRRSQRDPTARTQGDDDEENEEDEEDEEDEEGTMSRQSSGNPNGTNSKQPF